jgi:hypothetical protein
MVFGAPAARVGDRSQQRVNVFTRGFGFPHLAHEFQRRAVPTVNVGATCEAIGYR